MNAIPISLTAQIAYRRFFEEVKRDQRLHVLVGVQLDRNDLRRSGIEQQFPFTVSYFVVLRGGLKLIHDENHTGTQ